MADLINSVDISQVNLKLKSFQSEDEPEMFSPVSGEPGMNKKIAGAHSPSSIKFEYTEEN